MANMLHASLPRASRATPSVPVAEPDLKGWTVKAVTPPTTADYPIWTWSRGQGLILVMGPPHACLVSATHWKGLEAPVVPAIPPRRDELDREACLAAFQGECLDNAHATTPGSEYAKGWAAALKFRDQELEDFIIRGSYVASGPWRAALAEKFNLKLS